MHKLLSEQELKGVRLLVTANKQDLQSMISVHEVKEKLGLNKMKQKDRKWTINATSAKTGKLFAGDFCEMYQALDWIIIML